MPYLPQDHKDEIEKVTELQNAAEYLASKTASDFAGAVNYVNFVILKKRIEANEGQFKRYFTFAAWVGTLVCCIFEAYRRIIGPYEDQAIAKNGDVD